MNAARNSPSSPPISKPFKHTWRLDQPGHPEVVGRNEWSGIDARSLAIRAGGEVIVGALGSLFAGESVDSGQAPPRVLVWKGGGEAVMTTGSGHPYRIHAEWLDRRLAFAMAVLGDQPPSHRRHPENP